MNILVVLRPVRDPAAFSVNRKAQKIFVNRDQFITNPADRNALEAALRLAGADDTVTAVALGGEPALEALRMARATGADRALCVAVPGTVALDALGTTRVLQSIVAHLGGVDLVLLGAEVLDSDTAQVGARLAAALGWPCVDHIYQINAVGAGTLGLIVSAGGGYRQLGVIGPAVATVARDSNKPRFAPAAHIITVYTDPAAIGNLTLADLGLDETDLAAATTVRGESFPPERTLGQIMEGETAVRQVVEAIRNR